MFTHTKKRNIITVKIIILLILNFVEYLLSGEDSTTSDSEKPHADIFHGFTQPAQLDNLLLSTQGVMKAVFPVRRIRNILDFSDSFLFLSFFCVLSNFFTLSPLSD